MSNLNYVLARARIDDLLREAAEWRRASESRSQCREARYASASCRRLTHGLSTLHRILRPSAQSPAALVRESQPVKHPAPNR
jgi:predicted nucleic acid-binding Zn ribbon protein